MPGQPPPQAGTTTPALQNAVRRLTAKGKGKNDAQPAEPRSVAVERLLQRDALLLGRTTMPPLAQVIPAAQHTRNPAAPLGTVYSPGGSSSGSAAAVAAGLCDFAVGTQTAGSVIRPAAFCGVLGAVPAYSEARDSGMLAGLVPAAPPLDVVGVLSGSWDILYAAMGAMLGRRTEAYKPEAHSGESGASRVKGRLALPVGPYAQQASAEARSILDAAALFLEQEGIMEVSTVEPWDAAQLEAVRRAHHSILAHEMHIYFGAGLSAAPLDEKGHALDELLRAGGRVTDAELRDCLTLQESEARRLSLLAEEHGILGWLAPSTVSHAPAGLESTGMQRLQKNGYKPMRIEASEEKEYEARVSPASFNPQEAPP